jgi:hypothetical protein
VPVLNLNDIDLELGLFATDSIAELGDGWVSDGNPFGECVVPPFDRIVSSRQLRTYSVMYVPERDWERWLLPGCS